MLTPIWIKKGGAGMLMCPALLWKLNNKTFNEKISSTIDMKQIQMNQMLCSFAENITPAHVSRP